MKLTQAFGISVVAVATLLAAAVWLDHTSPVKTARTSTSSASDSRCEGQEIAAFVMSHEAVRQRLKAPSTAHFPTIADEGVLSTYSGDCTYSVAGYVDAENGFGAKLRVRYSATLKKERTSEQWAVLRVRILEQ